VNWWTVLSGSCATLIAIGNARFACTPLLPAVVSEGWFSEEEASYLAAANLGGYLVGVMMAGRLAARVSLTATLLLSLGTYNSAAVHLRLVDTLVRYRRVT
jgi:fucose permease